MKIKIACFAALTSLVLALAVAQFRAPITSGTLLMAQTGPVPTCDPRVPKCNGGTKPTKASR